MNITSTLGNKVYTTVTNTNPVMATLKILTTKKNTGRNGNSIDEKAHGSATCIGWLTGVTRINHN